MNDTDYAATYAGDPASPELHNLNHALIDLCEDIAAHGDEHAEDTDPPAFTHALPDELLARIGHALADVDAAGPLDTTANPFVAQSVITRAAALRTAVQLHTVTTGAQ